MTIGAFDTADWVQYNGQPAVNISSAVTWKTKLKPGEKFEPSVTYHYFTRHQGLRKMAGAAMKGFRRAVATIAPRTDDRSIA